MPERRQLGLQQAITASLALVGVLFFMLAAEILLRLPLRQYGIIPRTAAGLLGIALSPLLHASWGHLFANAVPLFVLMLLLLTNQQYRPYWTLALIWLASGTGTWLIGRSHSVHIGASSVIFGLAAFLMVAGFRVRSWRTAAVAVLVFLLYGGIFYGVLPQAGSISWEGHLCGAGAGVLAARRL